MSLIKNIKKNYFFYYAFILALVGIHYSLRVGITHDELYDLQVWQANQNIFFNTFFNYDLDTSILAGAGKYYGSGFHIFSLPIEIIIQKISFLSQFDSEAKLLISKHVSVFISFLISGLLLRSILKIITKSNLCSNVGSMFYLTYPYLLGHSFFNIKDIPFLSAWMICTFLIIKISKILIEKNVIKIKYVILLSFFTAYLMSIRISGILIFFQYLVFLLVLLNTLKINLVILLKKNLKNIVLFFCTFILFFLLIQPNYWENPLQFIEAIKYMSQHIQTVCTITLGECMGAQNLPATYIPIWIFFKLPIIIIIGLFLYPLIEKQFKQNSFNLIVINSLILTTLLLVFLLIIFEVNLYDEIRQIMFLVPLLIIISISQLFYFSRKLFLISMSFFLIFFIFQNIKIFPYNYLWINNFSHLTKINKIFELDYWGVASKPVAEVVKNESSNVNECIISNRSDGIKPFVKNNQCILKFNQLHNKIKRPFYVSLTERNLNKGTPNNCQLIFREVRNFNFSKEEITLAKLYRCN